MSILMCLFEKRVMGGEVGVVSFVEERRRMVCM